MKITKLAEVYADKLFGEDNINWQWCVQEANFIHQRACEFIIHIGNPDYWEERVKEMRAFGCTEDFIQAYLAAKNAGAMRVLFYV